MSKLNYEQLEVLNLVRPEHDRDSCSDDDTCNGWYSQHSTGEFRCKRCAMIERLMGETEFGGDLPSVEFMNNELMK